MLEQLIANSKDPTSGILFVAEVPHRAIVRGHQWQLDLLSIVTDPQREGLRAIIGVDITFNCSEYFVTPMVFAHPLLINAHGKQPFILEPLLITNSRDKKAFATFGHALTIHKPSLKDRKFIIGCDSQLAMYNGLSLAFNSPKLILCTKHIKDNIKRQLQKFHSRSRKIILNDIFYGENSLINQTDDTFDKALSNAHNKWETLAEGFHAWFTKHQSHRFKKGLILPRRREAGLVGDEEYYNNHTESLNKLIKKGNNAKTTIVKLTQHVNKESEITKRNIDRSVIGQGPYKIASKFKKQYEIDFDTWSQMSKKQKLTNLSRFWKGPKPSLDSTSYIVVKSKLDTIGNRSGKSKKPGEKFRIRQNRNRCMSALHKNNGYMHLKLSKRLTKNVTCSNCKRAIDKTIKTSGNIIAAMLKCQKTYHRGMKIGVKFVTLHAHLKCIGVSYEFYKRKLHICPEIEAILTGEQQDMICRFL